MSRILIMGLPGSGKTYMAEALKKYLEEHGEISYARALNEHVGDFGCQVKSYIKRDLDPLFQGQYEIQVVPNIVNITYGRDVGYKIEQETFDDATHSISATKIRKELGFK